MISAVVKGNAYGHGDTEVVKILSPYVDYFQVNSIEELVRIKKVTKKPILVFGYVAKDDLEKAIKIGCILTVFSKEQLLNISAIAGSLNKVQEIHLAFDAYLGREGFLENELPKVFNLIVKTKNIKLTGIYAHFANIEDTADFSHAEKQIKKYQDILKMSRDFGFKNLQTHISSTAGAMVYEPVGKNNIVRLGIGLYGLWPSKHLENKFAKNINLKPVLTWKTHIAQIKTLPKNYSIGYGLTFITKKETKIALIPQGYADGFSRGLSNNGEVLISGTKCKVLGRVAMNMFVVDVSHLKKVKIEDEVVLLGKQGNREITAEELAKKQNTINYEVVTKINPLLPRVVK